MVALFTFPCLWITLLLPPMETDFKDKQTIHLESFADGVRRVMDSEPPILVREDPPEEAEADFFVEWQLTPSDISS